MNRSLSPTQSMLALLAICVLATAGFYLAPGTWLNQPSDTNSNAIANYKNFLSSADPGRKFILDVQPGIDGEVVITVSQGWLIQSEAARLENANGLWEAWVKENGGERVDHWRIKIVSQSGERVGGSGMIGSIIDVAD
jgi:hypothetical protein